jgi:hypothetical protein
MSRKLNFKLCLEAPPNWDVPGEDGASCVVMAIDCPPKKLYFKVFSDRRSTLLMIRTDQQTSVFQFTEGLLRLVDLLGQQSPQKEITFKSLKEVFQTLDFKDIISKNSEVQPDERYTKGDILWKRIAESVLKNNRNKFYLIFKQMHHLLSHEFLDSEVALKLLTGVDEIANDKTKLERLKVSSLLQQLLASAVSAKFFTDELSKYRGLDEMSPKKSVPLERNTPDKGSTDIEAASNDQEKSVATTNEPKEADPHPQNTHSEELIEEKADLQSEPKQAEQIEEAAAMSVLESSILSTSFQDSQSRYEQTSDALYYPTSASHEYRDTFMKEATGTQTAHLSDHLRAFIIQLRKSIDSSIYKRSGDELAKHVLGLSEVKHRLAAFPLVTAIDMFFRLNGIRMCSRSFAKCSDRQCLDHEKKRKLEEVQLALVAEYRRVVNKGQNRSLDKTLFSLSRMVAYYYETACTSTKYYFGDNLLELIDFHDSDLDVRFLSRLLEAFLVRKEADALKYILILDNIGTEKMNDALALLIQENENIDFSVPSFIKDYSDRMASYMLQGNQEYMLLKRFMRILDKATKAALINDDFVIRTTHSLINWSVTIGKKEETEATLIVFTSAGDLNQVKKYCMNLILRKLSDGKSKGFVSSVLSACKEFFSIDKKSELPAEISAYINEKVIKDPKEVLAELVDPRQGLITFEILQYLRKQAEVDPVLFSAINSLFAKMLSIGRQIRDADPLIELALFQRIDGKLEQLENVGRFFDIGCLKSAEQLVEPMNQMRTLATLHSSVLASLKLISLNKETPFDKLDTAQVDQLVCLLENLSAVQLADIKTARQIASQCSSTLKVMNLIEFRPLVQQLQNALPGRERYDMREMEGYCAQTIEAIKTKLSESQRYIKSYELPFLASVARLMQNAELRARMIDLGVTKKDDCEDLLGLVKACELAAEQVQIKASKLQVGKMLDELKKIDSINRSDSDSDAFFNKLEQIANQWESKYECSTAILKSFVKQCQRSIQSLHGRLEIIKHLGSFGPLFKFFKEKKGKHFDNMRFYNGDFATLDQHLIGGLVRIVDTFKTPNVFESELQFIEHCCEKLEGVNLAKILENAENLQDCFKAVQDGANNGQMIIDSMAAGGTVYFRYSEKANNFSVLGIRTAKQSEINTALNTGLDPTGNPKKGSNLFSFRELIETKIRVAVISAENSTEPTEEERESQAKLDNYAFIVEQVEGILECLNAIMRSGDVLILENFIEDLVEKANLKANENPFWAEEKETLGNLRNFLVIRQNDLSLQAGNMQKSQGGHCSFHFKILNDLLQEYIVENNKIVFEKTRCSHILSHLTGKQKLLLCKTLNSSCSRDSQEFRVCTSLLKFITGNPQVAFKPIKLEQSTYTDDLLLQYLKKSGIHGNQPLPTKNSGKNKKIKFFSYRSKDKYKDLFELLASKRIREVSPQKLMFTSHCTTVHELENFLMKAFCDPQNEFYFLVDLHLLRPEAVNGLLLACKRHLQFNEAINLNCILLCDSQKGAIMNELIKNAHLFETDIGIPTSVEVNAQQRVLSSVQFVISDISGMGKSFYIRKEAAKAGCRLVTIMIGGDPSKDALEKRLEIIEKELRSEGGNRLALHLKLDLMDNMIESVNLLDHLLFKISYLRCVDYHDGYLYLKDLSSIYIEVQNSYQNFLIDSLAFSKTCKRIDMPPLTKTNMNNIIDIPSLKVQRVKIVCSFYRAIEDQMIGANQVTQLSKTYFPQENETSYPKMIEILHKLMFSPLGGSLAKKEQDGSIQMLKYLIKVLYYQITQMELVPAMNPTVYDSEAGNSARYQAFMKTLSDSRLTTAKNILHLAHALVWSASKELREEKGLCMKIASSGTQSKSDDKLIEYCKKVEQIPKWEYTNQIIYFFNGQAMKVLYKDFNKVTKDIKSLISDQTKDRSSITHR